MIQRSTKRPTHLLTQKFRSLILPSQPCKSEHWRLAPELMVSTAGHYCSQSTSHIHPQSLCPPFALAQGRPASATLNPQHLASRSRPDTASACRAATTTSAEDRASAATSNKGSSGLMPRYPSIAWHVPMLLCWPHIRWQAVLHSRQLKVSFSV